MSKNKLAKTYVFCLFILAAIPAFGNVRKIGTWNVAFLGGDSWQNTIENIENVKDYAALIDKSGATLFALQELVASKLEYGEYSSLYLDEMVNVLNAKTMGDWTCYIGKQSSGQRLGFLYDKDQWECVKVGNPVSGGAFHSKTRWPLFGSFRAIGHDANLTFCVVNVHMKAMPDKKLSDKNRSKRKAQFHALAQYLQQSAWDGDVIVCGDTNIYEFQSQANILLDQDTDEPLTDMNYSEVAGESERTVIYKDQLSQRFDRFYLSPDMQNEVESAKTQGGLTQSQLVDSLQEEASGDYKDFTDRFTDHFPVVLALDVSCER